jgi:hypothetical protein
MIRANFDHKKYLNFLRAINKQAHAESVRNLLNFQAKGSEKEIKKTVKRKFEIRTKYTLNSIKQDRQPLGNNINRMFSRVVTVSPYLYKQEDGFKEDRKTIPTKFTRQNNFKKVVKRLYRQDKLGNFGAKYYATTARGFFLGKPKGSLRGNERGYGIWMRHNNNKRLTKIKNVSRSDIMIKPTKFFQDAIEVFRSQDKIKKIFSVDAQRRLKETARNFYTLK